MHTSLFFGKFVPNTSAFVVVVGVVVVFTLNPSFYPTTSVIHPVSVLIIHPRKIEILLSQTAKQEKLSGRQIS